MKKIDVKTQMMDAGIAYFKSGDSFGAVIGSVKAQLGRFGTVLTVGEDGGAFDRVVSQDALPRSTGPADFFMVHSTPWRSRYISCKVEDAGSADTGSGDGGDLGDGRGRGLADDGNLGEAAANDAGSADTGSGSKGGDAASGHGGMERYAARLKEGNRNTPLRLWTLIALAVAAFVAGSFVCRGCVWTVVGMAASLWLVWTLIAPSKAARKTLLAVKRGIEEGRKA